MVATPDSFGKTALATFDSVLEELIIQEYGSTLFERQHEVIKLADGLRLYAFYELNQCLLEDLLENCGQDFDYWLADSRDAFVLGNYTAHLPCYA